MRGSLRRIFAATGIITLSGVILLAYFQGPATRLAAEFFEPWFLSSLLFAILVEFVVQVFRFRIRAQETESKGDQA
ncbi:MAG: hypothetical protein DWQ01_09205 [Planctomycetota bacterium]|nr:MAG: hypothetical protein DWQ01_09205 [Planctomycetota bacterium]